jgi:pantothenate kinase-related protein Tda10
MADKLNEISRAIGSLEEGQRATKIRDERLISFIKEQATGVATKVEASEAKMEKRHIENTRNFAVLDDLALRFEDVEKLAKDYGKMKQRGLGIVAGLGIAGGATGAGLKDLIGLIFRH